MVATGIPVKVIKIKVIKKLLKSVKGIPEESPGLVKKGAGEIPDNQD